MLIGCRGGFRDECASRYWQMWTLHCKTKVNSMEILMQPSPLQECLESVQWLEDHQQTDYIQPATNSQLLF